MKTLGCDAVVMSTSVENLLVSGQMTRLHDSIATNLNNIFNIDIYYSHTNTMTKITKTDICMVINNY